MEYKGGQLEGQRQAILEKQRKTMLDDIAKKKEQITKDTQVKIGSEKFVAQNDVGENELKKHTVGLVRLEDFERIKDALENKRKEEMDREAAKLHPKKKKKTNNAKAKLSFEDEDVLGSADPGPEIKPVDPKSWEDKKVKIRKDPSVDTSFLFDRERDEEERRARDELQEQWLEAQEKIKQEKIIITYSYWDGTGHRKEVEVKKGDTIGAFIEACRQQWHQLRNINVDNLMYVKEDLIIPHHYTFYDFIVNKTRGKSGPLFSFDVHDDVRLTVDATVETEESHAGKLIERAWYEKNKHIFPASRWEVFDAAKIYGKYTIKDLNKSKEGAI
ncbi:XAP5, circadian clock regulator-domain-containing protein [Cladochytrium replicatum]|nr:XAP5, circadian clock regulator-domain-containing protein [Cladochytrium replicatum]